MKHPFKESFDVFLQSHFKIEAAKYPFLSGPQIKQRVRNIWKKQQTSESKLHDKNSKTTSRRNISNKENVNCKTSPKQKPKKSLVPLKVDFVPSKGLLKRNSNSESNKRHVSFNKDLYIRYRTTSEESSNSTIKDRKQRRLRKNSNILHENNFSNNQFNSFNYGLNKHKNSEANKRFEELLNKNCSWSYKSQREKLNDTEANKKRFQTMDTESDYEIYYKNISGSNDKLYSRSRKKLSNDTSGKVNARHEEKCQKDQIGLNSLQMKTYGNTEKIKEIKPQNKYVKPRFSKSNKNTSMNLTDHGILSSVSSSDDDIFQTRYSMFDKHEYEVSDNINDYALNLIEISDEEDTLRNPANTKTSPVVIEAKAYEEKKYPVVDKKLSQTEQRETSLLKERKNKTELRDYFSEEKSSPNTNIQSSYVQISDDGLDDLDFSDNVSVGKSNKKCLKDMMVDVTVTSKQHSVSKNIDKPIVDEETILDDFFNGSFDITRYKPHSSEPNTFLTHYEKDTPEPVMQKGRKRKNYKRKITELETTNKRAKHETILEPQNKKNILTTTEGAIELHKKPSKKTLKEDKNLNSYQKSNTFSNKMQPRQKKTKEKFDSLNININFLGIADSTHENRQIRLKNCQKKYEDKNTDDTEEDRIQNKYSRRKVRSSSRIASKKIKEIEKIENLSDLEEIKISEEETETNIYDEILSTPKKHNYTETSYSLRGNSNALKPKTDRTNRKKERHENKNSKLSMHHENEFDAIKGREDIEENPEKNIMEKYTNDKQISRPFIHLLKIPNTSNIPIKQNQCTDSKQNQTLSLNSFYKYMENADHNLPNDYQTFEKRSTVDIDSENSDLTHHSNTYLKGENQLKDDGNNFTISKEYTKENKPRTWEMLENELLKNLDNEQQSDSVCQTVILKKQETVMKKEVVKDRNLFTVSNTSMLHTISKSKTGDKYNLKYEIKNTKSKFVGSKTDPTAQLMNRNDLNFKSNAIVNKTVTAMKKCTEKFLTPEVKLCNADLMESNWQNEKQSTNSDTYEVRQFHSHQTLVVQDKKYSKKFFGYKEKSKDQKSDKFYQKGSLSKTISETKRNERDSQKALCTEYSYNSNQNDLPIEYPQNHSNYNKTQALVPYKREIINPWDNLIDQLHLQEDYQDLNEEIINSDSEVKDQNTKSLVIAKTFTQNSNNLERNETMLIQTDYEVNKIKQSEETLSDQHISKDEESDTEQFKIQNPENKKFSHKENLTSRCISHQSNSEKILNDHENNEICQKLELQIINKNEIPKEHKLNTVSKRNAKKSPSFKFKLNKHGALKLKKHSSASSSSNVSEDSTEFKKTKLHERKGREGNTSVTNKAREKYKTYLKRLFDRQNTVIDEEDKTESIEDDTVTDENILKGPLDKSQHNFTKTDSLIARKEDDIFSVSSSSDESFDESKKNYGTGPLCELFDEY